MQQMWRSCTQNVGDVVSPSHTTKNIKKVASNIPKAKLEVNSDNHTNI